MLQAFGALSSAYQSLQATASPSSPTSTISKLASRLQLPPSLDGTSQPPNDGLTNEPPTTLEDRRAALLGLKGLSRDWRREVGRIAGRRLFGMLAGDRMILTQGGAGANERSKEWERGADAVNDTETAKALLETLNVLCELDEDTGGGRSGRSDSGQDVGEEGGDDGRSRQRSRTHSSLPNAGLVNTDQFLSSPAALHAVLERYLTSSNFYVRFFSLQLVGTLVGNRPAQLQSHLLLSPHSISSLLSPLTDSREILRNEALLLLLAMVSGNSSGTANQDVQKLIAFEGAFDKLFEIVKAEGGVDGGVVVQDCLGVVEGLIRWNVVNQNFFRETSCIPLLPSLLLFPPLPNPSSSPPASPPPPALTSWHLQSWPPQKLINASIIINIVRSLVAGAGQGRAANQKALLSCGMTRCLVELGVTSKAPPVLKAKALRALSEILRASAPNQSLLTSLWITFYPSNYSSSSVSSSGHHHHHPPSLHPHPHFPTTLSSSSSYANLTAPSSTTTTEFVPSRSATPSRAGTGRASGDSTSMYDSSSLTSGGGGPIPVTAFVALMSLAIYGDGQQQPSSNSTLDSDGSGEQESWKEGRDGLKLRAAAVEVLKSVMAANDDVKLGVLGTMRVGPSNDPTQSAGALLLHALRTLPRLSPSNPTYSSHCILFACLLFYHLIRNNERGKQLARQASSSSEAASSPVEEKRPTGGGGGEGETGDDEDEDEGMSLVHTLVGNLMMAQREQQQCLETSNNATSGIGGSINNNTPTPSATGPSGGDGSESVGTSTIAAPESNANTSKEMAEVMAAEWDRVMTGYLIVLSAWMWESPRTVRDFLEEGSNIQVLVSPITQASGADALVQGLSAFCLGIVYEYNREPGSITRTTLHPILTSRIGADQFVNRLTRLRDDPRFRLVNPDALGLIGVEPESEDPVAEMEGFGRDGGNDGGGSGPGGNEIGAGIWFDSSFVEFLKNSYLGIQRCILLDPESDSALRTSTDVAESAELITNLRATVNSQAKDVDLLHQKLADVERERHEERIHSKTHIDTLTNQLISYEVENKDLKDHLNSLQNQLHQSQNQLQRQYDQLQQQQHQDQGNPELDGSSEKHQKVIEDLREELESLKSHLSQLQLENTTLQQNSEDLRESLKNKESSGGEKEDSGDKEQEYEDLLVLLEELSGKRRRDKKRMREAGLEDVSDDEDDDDEGEGEGEGVD